MDLIRSFGGGLASGVSPLQAPFSAGVSAATKCIVLEAWGGARTVVLLVGLAHVSRLMTVLTLMSIATLAVQVFHEVGHGNFVVWLVGVNLIL